MADVDRHYEALSLEIEKRRALGQPIRILSDVTKAHRQNDDVEARSLWQMNRTFKPHDRVAILTAAVQDKQHVRMLLGDAYIAAFSSRLPAEMWLMSDDIEPPGLGGDIQPHAPSR